MHIAAHRIARFVLGALCAVSSLTLAAPSPALAATTFHVTGRGWGHGIGLSQYGARELARRENPDTGKPYTGADIIRYYYGNTSRTKVELVSPKSVYVRVDPAASSSTAYHSKKAWTLRAGNTANRLVVKASNLPTAGVPVPADGWYRFVPNGEGIAVYRGSTQWKPNGVSRLNGTVTVSEVGGVSPRLVQVFEKTGLFGRAYNRYRGSMRITARSGLLKLINQVSLEDYLYGVIPRESPASWGDETPAALQAQAIAARSYAYPTVGELFTTTMSQAYQGHSAGSDRSATQMWEDRRTNAAVDATRSKIARYHWPDGRTEIIRTFFSAASGGHTANLEDVWTSGTPKPYYVGVPDPDVSSTFHAKWPNAISYSDAALAAKLRAGSRTRSASEPSPATVTGVTITRAKNGSGYAVSVRTAWSNGKTHTTSGDAWRNALGLRSTKFSVGKNFVPKPPVVGNPAPPPLTRFEQSESKLATTGPWLTSKSSIFSGGSRLYTQTPNAWFSARFKGTRVLWTGTVGPAYGMADVYIDGERVKTVDLYRAESATKRSLFSDYGLTDGEHRLDIRVLDRRHASSKGSRVDVDAISITGELLQASTPRRRTDDSNPVLSWVGGWAKTSEDPELYFKRQTYTDTKGAKLYFAFTGTGFDWIARVANTGGMARVTVDGKTPVTVDSYNAETEAGQIVHRVEGLPWGRHTVKIETLGTKRAESKGTRVAVDAIDVLGGPLTTLMPPMVRVQDTNPAVVYRGTWGAQPVRGASGGYEKRASTRDASATVRFDGRGIRWMAAKGPDRGTATVHVDGKLRGTFDLYSTKTTAQQTIFRDLTLASGKHTIVVTVKGAKRSTSRGAWVGVDVFDVWGVAVR
ncbi:MAG: SpoIID/LytB domain-containing protein [Coriobacteriia bacterium]|nr:SpoIID/LytB domain-containing protein [Coriobacteriia bacterium]